MHTYFLTKILLSKKISKRENQIHRTCVIHFIEKRPNCSIDLPIKIIVSCFIGQTITRGCVANAARTTCVSLRACPFLYVCE